MILEINLSSFFYWVTFYPLNRHRTNPYQNQIMYGVSDDCNPLYFEMSWRCINKRRFPRKFMDYEWSLPYSTC